MSYIRGDFWRICDRCGGKVRQSATAKEWTGLIVCRTGCYEARHPQDFVRGRADRQAVNDPRPENLGHGQRIDVEGITIDSTDIAIDEQGDRFLDTNEVTAGDL